LDLPPAVLLAFERFKWRSRQLGRGVQGVVVTVLLLLLYVFGLGLTRLLASMFFRSHLEMMDGPALDSYWLDVEGYTSDPDQLLTQF